MLVSGLVAASELPERAAKVQPTLEPPGPVVVPCDAYDAGGGVVVVAPGEEGPKRRPACSQ